MTACYVLLAVVLGQQPGKGQPDKAPPPLTAEQRDRLQKLVRLTQEEAVSLKALLEKRQRELALLYSAFELNESAAEKLQAEVMDLQKRLLANYHRMQVELRRIVGPERFVTLRQRLDRIVNTPPTKEK